MCIIRTADPTRAERLLPDAIRDLNPLGYYGNTLYLDLSTVVMAPISPLLCRVF